MLLFFCYIVIKAIFNCKGSDCFGENEGKSVLEAEVVENFHTEKAANTAENVSRWG